MKKYYFLIIVALILGLVLTGCSLLSNISQVPANNQSGVSSITKNSITAICFDFNDFAAGDDVTVPGIIWDYLRIYSSNNELDLKVIESIEADDTYLYGSYNHLVGGAWRHWDSVNNKWIYHYNGCLNGGKGFGPVGSNRPLDNNNIVFEFATGVTVSTFSINMFDYGDMIHINDTTANNVFEVVLTAYQEDGSTVQDTYMISDGYPTDSTKYDACNDGIHNFVVGGIGIHRVEIEFNKDIDKGVGFDDICFTPEPIEVPMDIKPTSCPNPLNTKSKGVTPVAILGTADFDVTEIDPTTVILAGVPLLFWNLEDVATPFEPYTGKSDCELHCNTSGPDGYLDLTLKFDTPILLEAIRVLNAMGIIENFEISEEDIIAFENGEEELVTTDGIPLKDGICLTVTLNGTLYNGFSIVGEDVVRILQKGNNK